MFVVESVLQKNRSDRRDTPGKKWLDFGGGVPCYAETVIQKGHTGQGLVIVVA